MKFDIIKGKMYLALPEAASATSKLFHAAIYEGEHIETVFEPCAGWAADKAATEATMADLAKRFLTASTLLLGRTPPGR